MNMCGYGQVWPAAPLSSWTAGNPKILFLNCINILLLLVHDLFMYCSLLGV